MTSKPKQIGGQVLSELNAMMTIVEQYSTDMGWLIRKYLEVGCREGYALRRLVTSIDSVDTVLAIDWPGQDWGKVGSEVELNKNLDYLRHEHDVDATIYLGDSRDPAAKSFAEDLGPWDLCLIDASHVYETIHQKAEPTAPLSCGTRL
jgi:hypothetical protein